MPPRTGRKATAGDRSDPIVTTAASSQADTVSAGHPPPAAAAPPATPPAPPPGAARTRKPAVPKERPDAGRAVAYREQRCLRAPSRPSPSFGKTNGEGRPLSHTPTVPSHATPPQPEPPRKPRSPPKTL